MPVPLEKTRERQVVPYHTIAFSQQKLRAALRRAGGQEPAFGYGFVVHSRRQGEHPSLGLITLHGESLALNERLLQALDGMPLWLFGHARINFAAGTTLEAAEGSKAEPDQRPLASLVMHIATFDTHRADPASGPGRGAGQGGNAGPASPGPDPPASGGLAPLAVS